MRYHWPCTDNLTTAQHVLEVLTELRGKRWLCRGQAQLYGNLNPSIDRKREHLNRSEKLALERSSIDLFRSTARFFADDGEQAALHDDLVALMVLRHYSVPTRLIDWSLSPFVAAYFAVAGDTMEDEHDSEDGEIWSFDHDLYGVTGAEQWKRWPETTLQSDGVTFQADLTAFLSDEPPDWFVCYFYSAGFPRQNVQAGAYSMTARFGRDHADAIAQLLDDDAHFHRYIIRAKTKPALRKVLRERHGVWRGSLYPDSAGAAITACKVFSQP